MRKLFKEINAALSLLMSGWLAYTVGGQRAYDDFINELHVYVETGRVDTSWVEKYID